MTMQQSNLGSQSPLVSLETGGDWNFEFGFNSIAFSDRVFKIEILADQVGPTSMPPQKRRREEEEEEAANKNDNDDGPLKINQTSCKADCPTILRVELVHVSSIILAAKSQFFFKLFSNGMRESSQKDVTLQITASEEAAFMELLRFIYGQKFSSASHSFVSDLLRIADKFEVPSAMDYCIQLAMTLPMTEESALFYLNPPNFPIAANVQPLTDIAGEFLVNKYKDITKFQDEVLTLPLPAIELIFCSNDLEVRSEDIIFDLLVKWSHTNYPKREGQREIFASKLAPLIRFPQISCTRLRQFLASEDQYCDMITKFVSLALLFKTQAPESLQALAPEKWFIQRAYDDIPIKIIEFVSPFRQSVVYLDLKKEKMAKFLPKGEIYSEVFCQGGQYLGLWNQCSPSSSGGYFGLFLILYSDTTADFTFDIEFSVRAEPLGVFESKHKGCYSLLDNKAWDWGCTNLLGMSWASLMAGKSRYFIDEVLHLRAEVTIKPYSRNSQ